MADIFISTIADQLSSWSEAFPDSSMVESVQHINILADEDLFFWVHQHYAVDGLMQPYPLRNKWFLGVVSSLVRHFSNAKIVVLSNAPNQTEAIDALRFGAMGFAHAYSDVVVLKEIRSVIARGGVWIGQDALQQLIQASTKQLISDSNYVADQLAKLSAREQAVALEVAKGLTNKEVARKLSITERTVKAHLASAFERLGAKDRLQLALMLNKK